MQPTRPEERTADDREEFRIIRKEAYAGTLKTELRRDVTACSRCGGRHPGLAYAPVTNPRDEFKLWAICPTTLEPVFLAIVKTDNPELPWLQKKYGSVEQNPTIPQSPFAGIAAQIVGQSETRQHMASADEDQAYSSPRAVAVHLGRQGRDKITGFEGIVTGRAEYLYGCTQYCLAPKAAPDGAIRDSQWFDEGRIQFVGRGVLPAEVQGEKPGGPQRDAPRGR